MNRTHVMNTHTIGDCWELSKKDRADIARVQTFRYGLEDDDEESDVEDSEYDHLSPHE